MKDKFKIDEIRRIGLEALSTSLGPDGMIRFLQQYDSGSGNYSKDRHKLLNHYDVDSIYNEIKSK
jgi:hypothetical protein